MFPLPAAQEAEDGEEAAAGIEEPEMADGLRKEVADASRGWIARRAPA